MKKYLLVCISIICMFSSCICGEQDGKDPLQREDKNLMRHANNIEITHYKSGYRIEVVCPWDNIKSLGEFYLYPDSLQIPDDLSDKTVIRTPVKSVVAYSSTQWSVFLKLNEIQRVKGILESNYTKNKEIKRLINEGKIEDVGIETQINTEKIILLQPDIILYTPYSNVRKDDLGELCGAVMFPFADYLENHPLGRAEWLRVIGYLTGREEDTDEWFNDIERRYTEIKNICDSVTQRPTIFSDLPFEGQWYIPGGKSYIAQIFSDAGADYIWKDNNSTASQPIDAETVLLKAGKAEYWRVMNSADNPCSYELLAKENELFTFFESFKNRNIIICDIQKSAYFEKSQYEPDILLKDFVSILHPELIGDDYEPTYYYKLTNSGESNE
ncbi:MAG: ABC transporter substrate-binding protein [Candidatus Limimorpha sp.]